MPNVEANGLSLEFDHFGSADAEPVLLISGLGVQMIRWTAPFCETLAAQGFRVIRFDNRDVGRSTHFDKAPVIEMTALAQALGRGERLDLAYSLRDMADDAIGLLDVLEIERAHIVGRSMGGMVVHGADDLLIPVAGGQDTAANIEGSRLMVIEGMGHDLPVELYETVARAIAGNAGRAIAGVSARDLASQG